MSNRTLASLYNEMIDGLATFQVGLLRRMSLLMEDEFDREAMRQVEGAKEWRHPKSDRRFQT